MSRPVAGYICLLGIYGTRRSHEPTRLDAVWRKKQFNFHLESKRMRKRRSNLVSKSLKKIKRSNFPVAKEVEIALSKHIHNFDKKVRRIVFFARCL